MKKSQRYLNYKKNTNKVLTKHNIKSYVDNNITNLGNKKLLENVSVIAYVDKNITNLNIKKWLIKVEKIINTT